MHEHHNNINNYHRQDPSMDAKIRGWKFKQKQDILFQSGLVAKSGPTLERLRTGACQAPLSMGFPRQEYWSGLPVPSPGDLPDPGITPRSPVLQADSLPTEPAGKLLF